MLRVVLLCLCLLFVFADERILLEHDVPKVGIIGGGIGGLCKFN